MRSPESSNVPPEVRIAGFIAGKRRWFFESLGRVGRALAVGIAADAASVLGLPLEEGRIKRVQDRLNKKRVI